jgi:hypothetical protein
MTYTILETQVNGDTINTKVEYNFDGTILVIDVPHFMPQTMQDIETGILNRAVSEKRKLDAEELNLTLVNYIVTGEEKSL